MQGGTTQGCGACSPTDATPPSSWPAVNRQAAGPRKATHCAAFLRSRGGRAAAEAEARRWQRA
jgi:hypothetical protein